MVLLCCDQFSSVLLLARYQEWQLAHKNPVLVILRSSLLEQVDKETEGEPANPSIDV